MKITAKPKRVDDLLRFLRDGGYVAREAGFGIVEIDLVDEGRRPPRLESELEMWSAVNRTEVRIVTNGGSHGLQSAEPAEDDPRAVIRTEVRTATNGGSRGLRTAEPAEDDARARFRDPLLAVSPRTTIESELEMWSAVDRTDVRVVTNGGSHRVQAADPAEDDARTRFPDPLPAVSPRTTNDSLGRTVVLLDRHALWLRTLEGVFNEPDYTVVGTTTRLAEAIELVRSHRPDLLIAELAGDEPGAVPDATLDAIRDLRRDHRSLRVVVMSSSGAHEDVQQALAAGAAACVLKTAAPDALAFAVRQTFRQSMFFAVSPQGSMRQGTDQDRLLTPREREILDLVAEGGTTAELAHQLWVSQSTVKFHLSNIYKKLGVSNRTQASRWARRHGVATMEDRSLIDAA